MIDALHVQRAKLGEVLQAMELSQRDQVEGDLAVRGIIKSEHLQAKLDAGNNLVYDGQARFADSASNGYRCEVLPYADVLERPVA
jgi:hypothetical protein